MKKTFTTPTVELVYLYEEDCITASIAFDNQLSEWDESIGA